MSFFSFKKKKLNFTTFAPPGKIFMATSGHIPLMASPGKDPSDSHAYIDCKNSSSVTSRRDECKS